MKIDQEQEGQRGNSVNHIEGSFFHHQEKLCQYMSDNSSVYIVVMRYLGGENLVDGCDSLASQK